MRLLLPWYFDKTETKDLILLIVFSSVCGGETNEIKWTLKPLFISSKAKQHGLSIPPDIKWRVEPLIPTGKPPKCTIVFTE